MGEATFSNTSAVLGHDLRNQINSMSLVIQVLQRRLSKLPDFQADLENLETLRKLVHETVKKLDARLAVEAPH